MAESNQSKYQCPNCGSTIGAVSGLCSKCLLAAGMGNLSPNLQTQSFNRTSSSPTRFEPPTVEALSAEFPELEIMELAGRGGMGAVYKANQKGLNRIVALKILPPEVAEEPAFALRFSREARALAQLNHPNIVQVFQTGKSDSYFYFLMEFVEGVNLRETIRAGQLTPDAALAIVPQICEALQYAHNQGIVHRDIKPENILLDRDGKVKVTDFGLAKVVDSGIDMSLTGTQQMMGTAHYMAPEQVQETRAVDHRADIYSLGVVFYEMLTGQLPIGRFAVPSETHGTDPRLDEVVLRTLENEPDRRYQAANDVKTDIDLVSNSPEFDSAQVAHAAPPIGTRQPAVDQALSSFGVNASPPVKKLAPKNIPLEQTEADKALRPLWLPGLILEVLGIIGVATIASVTAGGMVALVLSFLTDFKLVDSANFLEFGLHATNYLLLQAVPVEATPPLEPSLDFQLFAGASLLIFHLPLAIMAIVAGRKMRKGEGYGFCIVVCALLLIPLAPTFWCILNFGTRAPMLASWVLLAGMLIYTIKLGVGSWCLAVLFQNDVRKTFLSRRIGT